MRPPRQLSIVIALLSVIGLTGCNGGGSPGAGGPVKISMLRTPAGSRPLVWIEPCDEAFEPTNAPSGRYALIVQRDAQPYYFRTLEPGEIKGGCEKDLDIPMIEPGKKWSVAVERVVRGKETQAISNRLAFDPLDTSPIAISRPPMPVACNDWVVTISGSEVSINQKVTFSLPMSQQDATALLTFLGPPSRKETGPLRTMTWDKLGIYARGDETKVSEVGFLLARSDYSINSHPNHQFGGKFVVEGKSVDTSLSEQAFESSSPKHGKISTLFRRDGKLGAIELRNAL
jgi:hypothetical protein